MYIALSLQTFEITSTMIFESRNYYRVRRVPLRRCVHLCIFALTWLFEGLMSAEPESFHNVGIFLNLRSADEFTAHSKQSALSVCKRPVEQTRVIHSIINPLLRRYQTAGCILSVAHSNYIIPSWGISAFMTKAKKKRHIYRRGKMRCDCVTQRLDLYWFL